MFRGPGGAVLNYVDTTFGGQRATTQLIAGGALDRHPNLKVLVSEGGAAWAPFLGDRMNEGYRQHSMFVRPDAVDAAEGVHLPAGLRLVPARRDRGADRDLGMGYQNVMFGSDYPHLEGTYGHTQKTLHELFDDVDPEGAPPDHDRGVPRPLPAHRRTAAQRLNRPTAGLPYGVAPPCALGCLRPATARLGSRPEREPSSAHPPDEEAQ